MYSGKSIFKEDIHDIQISAKYDAMPKMMDKAVTTDRRWRVNRSLDLTASLQVKDIYFWNQETSHITVPAFLSAFCPIPKYHSRKLCLAPSMSSRLPYLIFWAWPLFPATSRSTSKGVSKASPFIKIHRHSTYIFFFDCLLHIA